MIVSETLLKDLYNREVKETFLREYLEDEGTRETYAVYLKQASDWEHKINKDLYEFSREDVLDLFSNAFTVNHTTLRLYHSVCKQYGNWATMRGYNKTGINAFELVKFKQHILPMLNKKGLRDKYLTEEQMWEVANQARNYQDSVGLILSFYGIKGNKCVELINLTREDVDTVNNKITILSKLDENTGEITTRTVELPAKVIDIMLQAWGETEYIKSDNPNAKADYVSLSNTDYILKPAIAGKNQAQIKKKISAQTIAIRIKKLLVSAGYEDNSIQDIYVSGKLNLLKKIEKENGELTVDDFKLINILFGDNENNYSNLKQLYSLLKESKAE